MSVRGPITRTVADAALFLDACHGAIDVDATQAPAPGEPFAAAAARAPGTLRVALSFKVPPGVVAPLHAEARRATAEMAEVLRSLGHEVVERDPDYGPLVSGNATVRVLRGIADDAERYQPLSRLERRTRGLARMGRAFPNALVARSRADEAAIAARLGVLWDDVDVLLTPTLAKPPLRVGQLDGRGALWAFLAATAFIPYTPPWNVTGQPAVSVPAGFTPDGLPLGVQLVGRADDEATLLSLAGQVEAERPWADRQPPVA
jgi:amidase